MTKNYYIDADASCAFNPVKIAGIASYFTSVQSSLSGLQNGAVIQMQGTVFAENNLIPPEDVSLRLSGGYNCDYSSNPGYSTILGTLTIRHGTVTIENLIIQ
jgi:hypothetical protein